MCSLLRATRRATNNSARDDCGNKDISVRGPPKCASPSDGDRLPQRLTVVDCGCGCRGDVGDRAQQHPGRQTTPPATVKDSSCRTGQDRTSLRRGCSKEWTVDCGREGRTGCLGREQQRERKSGFAERGTSKGSKVKSKAPVPVPVPVQGQRGRLRQRSPAQQASCRPP
ncbi:hypothetical protein L207DRAFT_525596 [Hyaloscypha variabilis F]|uniref:Uncharacterized protein n=1 Tax=Hyaloscypha variabilis (strain UAMH 11265 / GT02V1 / F) TaxID=1149755 RepID=A0A2J6S0J5_HYAVF|nr:hypothetical protein L207DRAFT_525596 [Hyaloscypha variabilis F]